MILGSLIRSYSWGAETKLLMTPETSVPKSICCVGNRVMDDTGRSH